MIVRSSTSCSPTCPRRRWKALTTAPPTCRGAGSWRESGLTCFRRDCRTRAHWLSAHQKRSATIRVGESRSQSPRLSDFPSGRWRRMPERRNLPPEDLIDYLIILMTYGKTRHRVGAVLWTAADGYGAGGIRTHDTLRASSGREDRVRPRPVCAERHRAHTVHQPW